MVSRFVSREKRMTIDLIYPGSPEMLRLAVRAGYHDFPAAMCAVVSGESAAFLHLDRADGRLVAKEWSSGDNRLHELLSSAAVALGRPIVAIVPPNVGARASRLEMVTAVFDPMGVDTAFLEQERANQVADLINSDEFAATAKKGRVPVPAPRYDEEFERGMDWIVAGHGEPEEATSVPSVRLRSAGPPIPSRLPDGKEPGETASESKSREAISPWQPVLERELVPFGLAKGKLVLPRDNAKCTLRIAYNGPGEGRVTVYFGTDKVPTSPDLELPPGTWPLEFVGGAGERFSILAWAPDEGACTYKIEIYWEAA